MPKFRTLERLDALIPPLLETARIPGGAIAVVAKGETIFAKGYGYRDLDARLPMTADTVYPIASTTKAINATLLGMMVDEALLAWDAPVQQYLPRFRLRDPVVSAYVTLRDLVTMRTGLPRHDWVWMENPISRAELVERLRHLEPSAGLRERFQYNNLTVTLSGHVAEVVAGRRWEDLAREKLLEPLGMGTTGFVRPASGNVTMSYHENSRRELLTTRPLATEVTAPSGGAIHSTVEDMARWVAFNLVRSDTLTHIHAPQAVIAAGDAPEGMTGATYAMGWFVDTWNGRRRLSHSGYIHDVHSNVMLLPDDDIGLVSSTNFGCPRVARLMNEHAFAMMMASTPMQSIEERLVEYEQEIENIRKRDASARRVAGTGPTHDLGDYAGVYAHPGYGDIEIRRENEELAFRRHGLTLSLEHWHYDTWTVKSNDLFPIHAPHAFDPSSGFMFHIDREGKVASLEIPLEPAVAPIRFQRQE